MPKILATFSGRTGDIIWALPTVRALAERHGGKIDFACMPEYRNILPLLQQQSYIDKALVLEDWACTGSPCGDQPWEPPKESLKDWDTCYHLTYKYHPVDFLGNHTAREAGVLLVNPVTPFIDTIYVSEDTLDYSVFAFNPMYAAEKQEFIRKIMDTLPDKFFVDVTSFDWVKAAAMIRYARCFIGCRSSNYVLAHGVGQKNILVFEPHPHRSWSTFICPWGNEKQVFSAEEGIQVLGGWLA